MTDLNTIRYIVECTREYSRHVEYWRILAETKGQEKAALQQQIQCLESQLQEINDGREQRQELILSQRSEIQTLEDKLKQRCNVSFIPPIAPPSHEQTPPPAPFILQCTSYEANGEGSNIQTENDKGGLTERKRKMCTLMEAPDITEKRQRLDG
jgi:molybdopterin converting factor small subunit